MKKTIIILFLIPVILLAQATDIGYEHFKLGMSFEEITSNISKNYIKNWEIYTYNQNTNVPSPSNDKIVYGPSIAMGYFLESSNSDIVLRFTKGTSGKLSKIEIKTKYKDSTTVKKEFDNTKGIITYKYGKPHKGGGGTAGKWYDWKIDAEQYINLSAQYIYNQNVLILQYYNIRLNKESTEFLKEETKKSIYNKY